MIYYTQILNKVLVEYFKNQVEKLEQDNNSYNYYPDICIKFKNGEYKIISFFECTMMNEKEIDKHIKDQLFADLPYMDRKIREMVK